MRGWINIDLQSACLLFGLLLSVVPTASADILVVLNQQSEIHQAVLDGVRSNLGSLDTRLAIAGQDQVFGTGNEQTDGLDLGAYDLILTIGSRAARNVLEVNPENPVLCVLVPKMTYEHLLTVARTAGGYDNRAAIYIDQPPERQIALARTLLPQAQTAGLVVGSKTAKEGESLASLAAGYAMQLQLSELRAEDDPARGIKKMLLGSDLVLVFYDPVVLKPLTAKWLLYMAYQRRIPVIGFSQGYLKAGAVAAVFSTPEQIGRQAGEEINNWLNSGGGMLGTSSFPHFFEIGFNRSVAESLDLSFPSIEEARELVTRLLGESQ